ncbi:MAG: hypothetical protein SPE20_00230 [Helicobacter sp.]|uniref:hypothetical protein n=1 Tax=Helicobacter sp. TaxID=218 RepID=UPI002A7FF20C|nr:hypothetical protein [Helicobacter sp.]MDY4425780.1 hypothetical protein [Helicobacter sp.]
MVKRIFFALLLIFFANSKLFCNSLDFHIISLVGVQDYRVNQKFIQRLFDNQDEFLDGVGQPNLYKISKVLKENGLLKLTFGTPMELEVSFEIRQNPAAFMSVLSDVLGAMGYYYFLVKQSMLDSEKYCFVLSMNTEYAIDPVLLQEKLRDYGYNVSKIERQNVKQWVYVITQDILKYPKAVLLEKGIVQKNANLKGEYWYSLKEGGKLSISSLGNVLWYPKIVFFDENLGIIKVDSLEDSVNRTSVMIPSGTAFVKISDNYLPIVIKGGLSVTLE